MAAVKAMLSAAGFLDPEKDAARLGEMLGDKDLENIFALLAWMSQDFKRIPGITENDLMENGIAAIKERCLSWPTASIAKLSKLIDIMILDKSRKLKDANQTLAFMRKVAIMREGIQRKSSDNATERVVSATASDNATEHVELNEDEVSLCYRRFGRILLTKGLLPHQKQDSRYTLRNNFQGDTQLTKFQRSFTDNMLRKWLGDKKVAILIWQHGLPSIADTQLVCCREKDQREHYLGMLQSSLKNCLQWYGVLANEIVVHKTEPGFDSHLSASSLNKDEQELSRKRRAALQQAQDLARSYEALQQALRHGADLTRQRDVGKRSYDDMEHDEQDVLEDFETGRIKKAKQSKPFRCKLQLCD